MKIKVRHNLSDSELETVLKGLSKPVKISKPKLPAVNSAQEGISRFVVREFENVFVSGVPKEVKGLFE